VVRDAAYDEIANWYEDEFLGDRSEDGLPIGDPIGIDRALRELLERGVGICLEVGCGTGVHAARVRELGRDPIGIDLSPGMLRHARGRLPVALADGELLPFQDGSISSALAAMIHTDVRDYSTVVREVSRVLRSGGVFVHIGVHPCFCGGFADRSNRDAIVVRPGYLDRHWTKESWTDRGVRDKVGAMHLPLPELFRAFFEAGLVPESLVEGGEPTPMVLAIKARKIAGATMGAVS
jgi:SAM-dependent methyltransferase